MRLARSFRPNVRWTAGSLLACAASCVIAGCVSIRPIGPGVPFELGPDEGVLVVHVRTNPPVLSLDFGPGRQAASNLSEGEHLFLLGVDAGRYRWSEVTVDAATFKVAERRNASGAMMTFSHSSSRPVHFRLSAGDMRFSVSAGRINYVGMMLLDRTGIFSMMAVPIDRTASALAQIGERFPDAFERYPIVYSGQARHVFLDHYLAERDGAGGPKIGPPSASDSP